MTIFVGSLALIRTPEAVDSGVSPEGILRDDQENPILDDQENYIEVNV